MLSKQSKKGRLHVVAIDALFCAAIALLWSLALATPAYAYVDPSVMTYTIQALAGVAVAMSTVLGVVWRRARKKLLNLFHMDEDAHKLIESDVFRIDPRLKADADAKALAMFSYAKEKRDASTRLASAKQPPLQYKVIASFMVSLPLVLAFFVVAPYEIVAGNESSLAFGLADVWSVFVLPALVGTSLLTAVLSLLRGSAHRYAVLLVFGLTLATYVQLLALNGSLPSADGASVDWTKYSLRACVNTLIWLALVLLPVLLGNYYGTATLFVAVTVSAALVAAQGIELTSLFFAELSSNVEVTEQESKYIQTEKGLFTVSAKSNVIVFLLDMYDNVMDLGPEIEANEEFVSELTGFTWYTDVTAVTTPTRDAIPAMLTGYEPSPEEDYGSYKQSRWENATYLTDIKDAGYSIGLYSSALPTDISYIYDNAMNFVDENEEDDSIDSLDREGTLSALLQCSLFRNLPWPLKPLFWFYTDDINQAMVRQEESVLSEDEQTAYVTDDAAFAEKLRSRGLSISDDGESGAFRFIHLNGAHYPYTLNELGQETDENVTREQQCEGVMSIVVEYVRQLKELGLYDEATIIITSDHGYFESTDPLAGTSYPTNPILLIKPSQSSEEASAPLARSSEPASNADVLPTAFSGVVVPSQYGFAENLLAANNPKRIRYFCHLSKNDDGEHGVVQYMITGDANYFSNWVKTGWICHYPEGNWEYLDNQVEEQEQVAASP